MQRVVQLPSVSLYRQLAHPVWLLSEKVQRQKSIRKFKESKQKQVEKENKKVEKYGEEERS